MMPRPALSPAGDRHEPPPAGAAFLTRRPTIRDVAARAGVHPATASRALDPARVGRITAATTERVVRAATELAYTPDRMARGLRTRRSGIVGIVVPDLTNPVVPPIVRGIEAVLWGSGIACVLADTDNSPEREAQLVAELRDRRCDGFIVSSATRSSPVPAELAADGIPAVLVTRGTDRACLPLVTSDDASGIDAVVAHLHELGHRRLAYVAGPPELSTTVTRRDAFVAAVARRGLDPSGIRLTSCAAYTAAAAAPVVHDLLVSDPQVTAIVAGNDMIALGCFVALEEAGLSCPEDVSVVGFNDMPLVDRLKPALTTVSIPQHEIGTAAASLLLERIAGRSETTASVLLPTLLMVRDSTSGPRRG